MQIKTKTIDDKKVIIVSGEISGANTVRLSKTLKKFRQSDADKVFVELSNVEYIDSNCLGCFIYSQAVLKKCNKRIVFLAPNAYVKELFRDASFDKIFEIADNI